MKNETTAKGIMVILIFVSGLLLGWYVWSDEVVTEKIIEVEKIVVQKATHQDTYSYCASQAYGALYSTWNGEPKIGTTPQNTQDFIDDCFTKLTNQP